MLVKEKPGIASFSRITQGNNKPPGKEARFFVETKNPDTLSTIRLELGLDRDYLIAHH
jgi:hypothetical protein